jgi:ssDNA-binding Zn-finger/Zn-ribbon topoisomerase 1
MNAVKGSNPSVDSFVEKNTPKKAKEEKVSELIKEGYKVEHFEKYPRKFEFTPADKVRLPSNGLPYQSCDDKDVREGFVWVYPLTMKEEEILSTPKYINEGIATIMALNNCIKSNIDAMDLTVSDFYYLLMYLRQISISDNFSFNVSCPNCGNEFKHDIKISEQKFDELDKDSFNEPIRIDLPLTNYTVLLGLPRIRTIREISWMMNDSKEDIGVADVLYVRTIAIITPDGNEVPKSDWVVFYNNLPHKDYNRILEFTQLDSGISHIIGNVKCPNCGKEIEGSSIDLNTDALFRYDEGESEHNQE